jgi:hypothetical protein
MTLPGFSAESSLYRSAVHYHTLVSLVGAVEPIQFQDVSASPTVEVPSCRMSTDGSRLIHSFSTRVGDLNVTGGGNANTRSPDKQFSVTIDRAGVPLLSCDGTLSGDGVYATTCRYGAVVGGVRQATFVTSDGKHIEGMVNGRQLMPFTAAAPSLRFTDGTPVPQPSFPTGLASALKQVPQAVQAVLRACSRQGFSLGRAIVPASNGGTSTFGSPPRIDDPGLSTACTTCILEAYAALVACGAGCALSFGFACGCVAGIPLVFIRCHTPGTGVGQGCCPVACGPTHTQHGVDVVDQCCSDGDSCLDSSTGTCCGPGLQACNKSTCCPSNAPCRDVGICCPTNQNTCITAGGPVCCNQGEDCSQNVGCCSPGSVCGNKCCDSFSTCVDPNTGTCCPILTGIACGNQCCEATIEECINGDCCPKAQACNGFCCQTGSICANGQCISSCPDGEDFSTAPDGTATCCPLYQCDNPSNDNICVENYAPVAYVADQTNYAV